MKECLYHVILVIDTSHLASGLELKVTQGLNACVSSLKQAAGEVHLSLFAFGGPTKTLCTFAPVTSIRPFTRRSFPFSGEATLFGAIAFAIDDVGRRFAECDECERPEKVILAILSLGASEDMDMASSVAERFSHQRDVYKWDIQVFSPSNDVLSFAEQVGVRAVGFKEQGGGVPSAFDDLADAILEITGMVPKEREVPATAKKTKRALKVQA